MRPSEFPLSKWLVLDKVYTVAEVSKMNQQKGMLGFKLEEIDTSNCFPYTHFAAWRFEPTDTVPEESVTEELELETS